MKKNLSHCDSNRIPLENITVNCENGKFNKNNNENEQQLNERNTQELSHNV
uniref:Bm13580 n=1 Tax=Brugia malayi TaxID=6279 RepID=A0A0J9YGM9_BRUMA|nr:Bm13580 [Brugia malayi]